ncbi:WXG100 family type VII secretion target [Cryobacterium sp. TMT1-21]|uniref:ESAT-6-like protein n=1 Tax=Cryobacterium shii TaxID=1259235 RepID=A0AAQ2C4T6_9MICO|nr:MULTISPECIES: WXG100 family type VII secretion target [Cryobacterium]TFC42820.1 WXG100 family type VII secretion target [Cryobacterium shii]TFC86699.1 WXG100 family type VII secretion target [Cryobacterium sp. TmT2-59]TFD11619.1 WXG100 family type VII secretion target [Cryobacterium sp. TMT4-10]TFD14755.1 WXG100 family type VII secretion target [Cryobacterium sp. TMT1-21]TFD23263.1 WXG100 family type VII secretion target [Cryobacterium sp. TMT2-23]
MTRYQVDSEAVLHTTAVARASIGRIQTEVAGLISQLTALEGSWSGQAAAAFQSAVSEWRATQQQVAQSAEALGQALNQAGQHYAEIEQANTRLFLR